MHESPDKFLIAKLRPTKQSKPYSTCVWIKTNNQSKNINPERSGLSLGLKMASNVGFNET